MKRALHLIIVSLSLVGGGVALGDSDDYINFLRQVHLQSGVQRDSTIDASGSRPSFFPIEEGGARFELWTVKTDPFQSYLLATKWVSTYTPTASVEIISEDPHGPIPRTRADRGFSVRVNVGGLVNDMTAQEAARSVNFQRHVQSYGTNGTGRYLNRDQATLLTESSIDQNGESTLNFRITEVPGGNRLKVRGEERFTVMSLPDDSVPAGELDSKYIQVWPVSDAAISGMSEGDTVETHVPTITMTLNDLYPESTTYLQIYEGEAVLGTEGTIVDGSAIVVNDDVPQDREITITEWDELIGADGEWTLEVLTVTPFGTDRLATLTFNVERAIEVRGMMITSE